MATADTLIGKLLRRCPLADYFLAMDWLEEAFRQVWERRDWSWRRRDAHLRFNAAVSTGSCSITRGTNQVDLAGVAADSTWVGRQWRPSTAYPIYTITDYDSGAGAYVLIDTNWAMPDLPSGSTYEVYDAFLPVASDVDSILTAVYPTAPSDLSVLTTQEDLNNRDPRRTYAGIPTDIALRDMGTDGATARYEVWPHQKSDAVVAYTYLARLPDLSADGAVIPAYCTEDVLLQLSLAECAGWPGYEGRPNPYYRLGLVQIHQIRAERALLTMEIADQNRTVTDIIPNRERGGVTFDDGYHQSHDIGWD